MQKFVQLEGVIGAFLQSHKDTQGDCPYLPWCRGFKLFQICTLV
jgi:hypothetical protein